MRASFLMALVLLLYGCSSGSGDPAVKYAGACEIVYKNTVDPSNNGKHVFTYNASGEVTDTAFIPEGGTLEKPKLNCCGSNPANFLDFTPTCTVSPFDCVKDDQGRLISQHSINAQDDKNETRYTYNSQGLLEKSEQYLNEDRRGLRGFVYDSAGNLLKQEIYNEFDKLVESYTLSYDCWKK